MQKPSGVERQHVGHVSGLRARSSRGKQQSDDDLVPEVYSKLRPIQRISDESHSRMSELYIGFTSTSVKLFHMISVDDPERPPRLLIHHKLQSDTAVNSTPTMADGEVLRTDKSDIL